MKPMITIYEDWREAQATVLHRRDWATGETPEAILEGIRCAFGERLNPMQAVATILADVRHRGDAALRDWTARLDHVTLDALAVPRHQWEVALGSLERGLRQALERAAGRISLFHSHQRISSWTTRDLGGTVGQRVVPLRRVGIYVPGGATPLPSSLLMSVIPAHVAGVREIVVCTPPDGRDGQVAPAILAAALLAGVEALYSVGGAQAIGALAYGTASIPRVDKIAGPGGLFVTLAKRQLYGQVGLDGLYGPTETIIIADDSANPAWIAADLLAQAEHDLLATAILLTPCRPLAEQVQKQVQLQAACFPRSQVLRVALAGQGGIVVTPNLEIALQLADEFAPEHLCLSVRDPHRWADQIHNAGGLFLGEHSFEVLGDYVAGPSHIMPTSGTARFTSPLNVLDFTKIINVVALDRESAECLCGDAACLANAESLSAHAAAVRHRMGHAL